MCHVKSIFFCSKTLKNEFSEFDLFHGIFFNPSSLEGLICLTLLKITRFFFFQSVLSKIFSWIVANKATSSFLYRTITRLTAITEYLLSSEISFWYSVAPSVAATAPSCNDAFLQPEVGTSRSTRLNSWRDTAVDWNIDPFLVIHFHEISLSRSLNTSKCYSNVISKPAFSLLSIIFTL